MKNYLSKCYIKASLITLCVVLSIIAGLFFVNSFLAGFKTEIEENLSRHFDCKVVIGSLKYFPPNFIIIKDAFISQGEPEEPNRLVSIKKIKLNFSLKDCIKKRKFSVTAADLKKPVINCFECAEFLRKSPEKIIPFVVEAPKIEFLNIKVKDALIILSQDAKKAGIVFNSVFSIKNNLVVSEGSLNLSTFLIKDGEETDFRFVTKPFNYKLKGHFDNDKPNLPESYSKEKETDDGRISDSKTKHKLASFARESFLGKFTIERLEFKSKKFYSKLWGNLEKDILTINGTLAVINFFKEDTSYSRQPGMSDRIRKVIFRIRNVFRSHEEISPYDLYIYDLQYRLSLIPGGIQISPLTFSIKNIPFEVNAAFLFSKEPFLKLKLTSFPGKSEEERLKNYELFDVEVEGAFKQTGFNGRAIFDFAKNRKNGKVSQELECKFTNLDFSYIGQSQTKIVSEAAEIFYRTHDTTHKLFLEDFVILPEPKNKKTNFFKFKSKIYDGYLEGDGWVDTTKTPFRCLFNIKIKDISANKLSSTVDYFSKIYGKSSYQIQYKNYPDSNWQGKMSVSKGYLDNIQFFSWLADFFNIPQLKKVDFDKLSADFLVNNNVSSLNNINLESPEVTLEGYFKLHENDLVFSRLSLAMSRKLLLTSPRFKALLKMINKDVRLIPFDFRLSGLRNTMNFQWLNSEFKRKIRKAIPDFIERIIQRRLDDSIKAIYEEQP